MRAHNFLLFALLSSFSFFSAQATTVLGRRFARPAALGMRAYRSRLTDLPAGLRGSVMKPRTYPVAPTVAPTIVSASGKKNSWTPGDDLAKVRVKKDHFEEKYSHEERVARNKKYCQLWVKHRLLSAIEDYGLHDEEAHIKALCDTVKTHYAVYRDFSQDELIARSVLEEQDLLKMLFEQEVFHKIEEFETARMHRWEHHTRFSRFDELYDLASKETEDLSPQERLIRDALISSYIKHIFEVSSEHQPESIAGRVKDLRVKYEGLWRRGDILERASILNDLEG